MRATRSLKALTVTVALLTAFAPSLADAHDRRSRHHGSNHGYYARPFYGHRAIRTVIIRRPAPVRVVREVYVPARPAVCRTRRGRPAAKARSA